MCGVDALDIAWIARRAGESQGQRAHVIIVCAIDPEDEAAMPRKKRKTTKRRAGRPERR